MNLQTNWTDLRNSFKYSRS